MAVKVVAVLEQARNAIDALRIESLDDESYSDGILDSMGVLEELLVLWKEDPSSMIEELNLNEVDAIAE